MVAEIDVGPESGEALLADHGLRGHDLQTLPGAVLELGQAAVELGRAGAQLTRAGLELDHSVA